jgi:beta-RFAP synthase
MVIVQTTSRLHFGLFCPGGAAGSTDGVEAARRFGGAGLMIEQPGIRLSASPAKGWSATGPLAERVLAFAQRFADSVAAGSAGATPCAFRVEEAAPEHAGLGTGTQLALAVGQGLASVWGLRLSVAEIATRVGRGERSALGVHGFAQGGFLVEGGQSRSATLAPLVAHCAAPSKWRVLLVRPVGVTGTHGVAERAAMAGLRGSSSTTDALCRLVLLGMLPAIAEADVDSFGDALFEFNVRAGEPFAAVQGGTYSSNAVAEIVAFLRGEQLRGVGQSSWGPTVFAVVGGEDRALELMRRVRQRFGEACDIVLTRAAATGARVDVAPGGA